MSVAPRAGPLKLVGSELLGELSARAAASPRRRANHNLHPELADPVQRFLNAMDPGTYVRPHRHMAPEPKWELFVVLAGAVAVLLFDDAGAVVERVELAADGDLRGVEVPAGCWHSLVALRPGTVLFECKQGPYVALGDKDFAAWAPAEGEPGAAALLQRLAAARVGERLAA